MIAAIAVPYSGQIGFVHEPLSDWRAVSVSRIAGYQPGLGYYEGTYTFKPDPAKGADEYIIEKRVRYENGMALNQSGTGTLFSEYHLRYALAPTPLTGRIEGVFDLNGEKGFSGKWWTVVQDSNTFGSEQFCKNDHPMIIGVFPQSLKSVGFPKLARRIGASISIRESESPPVLIAVAVCGHAIDGWYRLEAELHSRFVGMRCSPLYNRCHWGPTDRA